MLKLPASKSIVKLGKAAPNLSDGSDGNLRLANSFLIGLNNGLRKELMIPFTNVINQLLKMSLILKQNFSQTIQKQRFLFSQS